MLRRREQTSKMRRQKSIGKTSRCQQCENSFVRFDLESGISGGWLQLQPGSDFDVETNKSENQTRKDST